MPIPLALPLLAQLPKAGLGLWQMIKAGKIDDTRPGYDIPGAATQAKNLAATQAGISTMPGYAETQSQIDQASGNAYASIQNTATSAGQALEAMTKVGAGAQGAKTNLGIANAGVVEDRKRMYKDALDTFAGYQDKKWAWEKQAEFMERMSAKSALTNAGILNTNNALDSAGGILTSKMMFDEYFPKVDAQEEVATNLSDNLTPRRVAPPSPFGNSVIPQIGPMGTPPPHWSATNPNAFSNILQSLQFMQGGGSNLGLQ